MEKQYYFLISNYHIINQKMVDLKSSIVVTLEDNNEDIIELNSDNRFIKCFDKPIDITIIEIIDSDELKKYIDFLSYDLNYLEGFGQYKHKNIFILQHPREMDIECGVGKITDINKFCFEHSAETDKGSSGSPVILVENYKVI